MSSGAGPPGRKSDVPVPGLLAEAGNRRCWLKLLEPVDAVAMPDWSSKGGPEHLRFDSRPNDVRRGHILFCVEPGKRLVVATVEALADGSTTLHDFEATENERWLFVLPVCPLAVVANMAMAPRMPQAGPAGHFSYRPLTRSQAAALRSDMAAVADAA